MNVFLLFNLFFFFFCLCTFQSNFVFFLVKPDAFSITCNFSHFITHITDSQEANIPGAQY